VKLSSILFIFFVSVAGEFRAQSDTLLPLVKFNGHAVLQASDMSSLDGLVFADREAVRIYFEQGSSKLSIGAQQQLNEVISELAKDKKLGLLITGYSDRGMSTKRNWRLSFERAQRVRSFFVLSGMKSHRFIARYLGDTGSISRNPADRVVVLEYIILE
jgi:outer membrane protein OmpA-like peptidoglycan-associated protein